jgi:osmotically-inducible protein OsmY
MNADTELKTRVLEELAWDPTIEAKEIAVAAKDGVVTLLGRVRTYAEKVGAERATQRVKGVRAVVQEIGVDLPPTHRVSDEEIATNALNVLRSNSYVPEERIRLTVQDGHLRLAGVVDWEFQRAEAENLLRMAHGVRGIDNQIVIKPRPSALQEAVKEQIEAAFERSAELDADQISVSAKDGVVELSGHVRTWHERDIAKRAAWSAPGVTEVVVDLHIKP